jgi:hypothetical protein
MWGMERIDLAQDRDSWWAQMLVTQNASAAWIELVKYFTLTEVWQHCHSPQSLG